MFLNYAALLATAGLVADVAAMYFPPKPTGLKYLTSKFQPGVTISYKQVDSSNPNLDLFTKNWQFRPTSVKQPQGLNLTVDMFIFLRIHLRDGTILLTPSSGILNPARILPMPHLLFSWKEGQEPALPSQLSVEMVHA
jgi:hypothetical protein